MTSYPKRLIEVDLPIKRISAHARREKSIRHGHISTLHIWWARRPLAACRAVLCAALWPDPADELCPDEFRQTAKNLMGLWAEKHISLMSDESSRRFIAVSKDRGTLEDNMELRKALLDFIADFANWDNSTVKEYLEVSRALTQSAHESFGGIPGTRPMVVDPFAGGGSIPLEALRVGADAFASDLNPVAVLLNKVVLEYIPKYGKTLADEVKKWGHRIKQEAEKELAEFYPKDPDGATPIAYLWARTIQCEGPGCGAEVPLMRSLWLAKKKTRSVALRIIPKPDQKRVDFEIIENVKADDVKDGTVHRGSATCPCCGFTTPVASVRKQFKPRKGGAADARLFCVVTTREKEKGRFYRLPNQADFEALKKAEEELERRKQVHTGELSLVPDEPTPMGGGSGAGRAFSQRNYGMEQFCDLFTPRQALALTALARMVSESDKYYEIGKHSDLLMAVQTCLSLVVDRQANTLTSLSRWHITGEKIEGLYARQAIPMVWDFAEANSFSGATGGLDGAINWIINVCESNSCLIHHGQIQQSDAANNPLPDNFAQMLCSDPPYYDSVPYADLSDFFIPWLQRNLGKNFSLGTVNNLSPKDEECIVDEIKGKDRTYFENKMQQAMAEGRRILSPDGIGIVVFAHKSTRGWEAQLQAMVDAGWTMTGSWPIDTEMGSRLRAMNSAALASSVHLVCRPRNKSDNSDNIGDWRDILSELPKRIHDWLPRLSEEGIVGADAIFACLGPALEIYSKYSAVEKASGEKVELKEYLVQVWAAVSHEALGMIFEGADSSGFEEDARLTAMWLWTLRTSAKNGAENKDDQGKAVRLSGYNLEYDAARKIAQGLGIHLENLTHLVQSKGATATLLSASSRTRYLFGKESTNPAKAKKKTSGQIAMFDTVEKESDEEIKDLLAKTGKTVLDQLHQSMILFGAGRGEAMKRFLVEDGMGRNPLFWRLAQSLSALYPSGTEEKRWVDGVLARKKGLGL